MRLHTFWAISLSSFSLTGCIHETSYSTIPREAVRAAAERVDAGAGSVMVRDQSGEFHTIENETVLHLTWPEAPGSTDVPLAVLREACRNNGEQGVRAEQATCALADERTHFALARTEHRPDWGKVTGYSLALALIGGSAALEVGCFSSWCSDTGRAAVITADLAVLPLALIFATAYVGPSRVCRTSLSG
jgi:hypothetical protein